MAKITDAGAFFKDVRWVTGPLEQKQVDVVTAMLTACGAASWPIGWVAYALATAWREAKFVPQDEWGKGEGRIYGRPGKHGGQIAYGRGLVQLTWDVGYEWADHALGLNGALLANYELANRADIAVRILVLGMQTGHFTGRNLADYIPGRGTVPQFILARKIINGEDHAQEVADNAVKFQTALDAGGWK